MAGRQPCVSNDETILFKQGNNESYTSRDDTTAAHTSDAATRLTLNQRGANHLKAGILQEREHRQRPNGEVVCLLVRQARSAHKQKRSPRTTLNRCPNHLYEVVALRVNCHITGTPPLT